VGKTALAVQWAHQVAELFPDGQLYVNLRGYDPAEPVTAADALAGFLRGLGVPGTDIPADGDERAARYRSLLAGRRVLVLADNASSADQVRPLLPGAPGCVAVVTSRDALSGLVARDGAQRLDLDRLPIADAVEVLRALIGSRVDDDPAAALALASACACLPIALRVAAELAAARPAVPLAGLAAQLADQQRRLDLLDAGGDPATAVRAVFSWSYRNLGPDTARAFRLTGLHPGPDLDAYAAAALTGTTIEQAGKLLGQLDRAHLIQPAVPGRHGMHDLLRGYARELAAAYDVEEERRAALTRLFDHYLHTAAAAMDTLFPAEQHRRPRIPAPATPAPAVTGPAAARGWLDAHRATLVAVAAHTADHGWPGHATRLAATVFRYLDTGGHCPEAVTIHSHARHAASQTSDRAAEAAALNNLAVAEWRQGRYQQATSQLQEALALSRQNGDRTGEARALGNLGSIDCEQGSYQQAVGRHQQALAIYRYTADRFGETGALNNLSLVEERQGSYQQAVGHLQQALAMSDASGDRTVQAYALTNLGDLDLRQGSYQQAAGHLQQALALFRQAGNRVGEVVALNGLGEVSLAAGQPGGARTHHATALGLAGQTGHKYQQARAHNGLARSYYKAGDPGQARHHWRQALALYTELGVPEANQVRAHLARADSHGHRGP
jgi:tetratricopeptide (TPR) repeat protein